MVDVPAEFRSKSPGRLRYLVRRHARGLRSLVRQEMLAAAAEIEGAEEAYGVLVDEVGGLRKRLAATTANHQHSLEFVARWRDLLLVLQAERPDDIRVQRALAGEHPLRPALSGRRAYARAQSNGEKDVQ